MIVVTRPSPPFPLGLHLTVENVFLAPNFQPARPTLPLTTLPQEIIDQILDHLHDDRAALLNCAVVCSAWLPTARLHIFSKICLVVPKSPISIHIYDPNDRSTVKQSARLRRFLSNSPDIIPHVRELYISSGFPSGLSSSAADGETCVPITDDPDYALAASSLVPLIMLFTQLRRFEFASQSSSSTPWTTLPLPVRRSLSHVFGLQSLTHVRLCCWEFPKPSDFASLIQHSPNLKGLFLWAIKIGSAEGSVDDPNDVEARILDAMWSRMFSQLDLLSFDHVQVPYIGDCFDLQPFPPTTKEVRVAHSNDKGISKLLQRLGGSLERFHHKPERIELAQPIDLSHNTALRCIRLTLEEFHPLSWAIDVLSTIPSPHLLERVAIEVYIALSRVDGWETLDCLLSRTSFSSLGQVDVGVFAQSNHPEFSRVEGQLSGLLARGILRVYQLGTKSQNGRLAAYTPLICSHDGNWEFCFDSRRG